MTNKGNQVLYTGVTSDLARRVCEHCQGSQQGFTKTYQVNKLVYFEAYQDVEHALAREKQLKGGSRKKKVALIEAENVYWLDLADKLGLGKI